MRDLITIPDSRTPSPAPAHKGRGHTSGWSEFRNYLLVFALGAVLVGTLTTALIRYQYASALVIWNQRQSTLTDDRRSLVNQWLKERRADAETLAGAPALEGRQIFGEFTDYRGARVLAATRRIEMTGWGLVSKIDRAEALEDFRSLSWLEIAAAAILLLAFGVALWVYRRQAVAREMDRATEAMHRASAYNRSLIEASLDPLVTISADGKITDVNAATEIVTGRTRSELIGSDFSDYFTDADKARAGYQQVFRNGVVQDFALEIRHRDGHLTPVLYNATVYRDERGEVAGVFAAARDITEKKRAEQAVESERERYNSILDRLPVYVVLITPDYHVPFANRYFRERFGESHGRCCYEYLFNRTEPCETCEGFKVLKSQEPCQWEWTGPNGREYLVRDFPFADTDGSPLILEMGMDITERKQAEEALRASEERFVLAVDGSRDGIWDWDLKSDVVYYAPRFKQLLGYQDHEFQNVFWEFESRLHPLDHERTLAAIQDHLKNKAPYEVEYRLRVKSGEYRWFRARGQALWDESGVAFRMAGSLTDISRERQAAEEIRKLNQNLEQRVRERTAELEAANKELEAFTYSVSHDLRAPLRHVDGFSNLLLEEFAAQLPEEARHYLERIRNGTRQMGQLVDDLLNLSRVGRHEPSPQITGLSSLVKEVVAELTAENPGRQIEWKIAPLPFVECDPMLMKQVLANLLSNAVKFTRPREPAVIEVGSCRHGGREEVFVRDNGVGFSMKFADKLFGVFQRLHRAEDFEGTGVGLATVQRIIHKHHGEVWADAELDRGATFYFTLGKETADSAVEKKAA